MDSSKVCLVLLYLYLLLPVLHVLWNDDSVSLTEQSSRCNHRLFLLCTLQSFLRLFHSETSKSLFHSDTMLSSSYCHRSTNDLGKLMVRPMCWIAENPKVVDLVLLDLPLVVVALWDDSYSIRRS